MQQEDLFSRVQCGMFSNELNAGFRARLQKIIEKHVDILYREAQTVAVNTNATHRLALIFRAGLDHTTTMTDAEKEQLRNEVMRQDPGFANYYEHAFYSYCAETVPELKEPSSVLRAMPPALHIALHEIIKAVDSDPSVRSGEFTHKMGYLEKAFFVESMIRVAFYELLFTHKALRNISMVRSSRTRPSTFGITADGGDDILSFRSFDVGNALAEVATATPAIIAAEAAGASTALLASKLREADAGSVASDWYNDDNNSSTAPSRMSIADVDNTSTTVVDDGSAAAASTTQEEEDNNTVVEEEEEVESSQSAVPSEATIDVLSGFGHDKPYGDLPPPSNGPEVPDPPAPPGRCCEDPECTDGDKCKGYNPCVCGDLECVRGSKCLLLPPSVHSFTDELTVKIGDGTTETVLTPGDSVSQVL